MTNLFKPKMPEPQKPMPMPDPVLAGAEARRQAILDASTRAGRRSTILTGLPMRRPDFGGAPAYDTYDAKSLG